MCTLLHHPGLKIEERMLKVQAEAVIIHQKFTWGAVTGRNIMLHSTAARNIVKRSFFIFTADYAMNAAIMRPPNRARLNFS